MEKVSIIVPIYNPGKKLNKCIKSILNQTYKDFELILVNDGSTDDSLNICKKYAYKDSRIIIINQNNQGAVKARKAGINNALGKYITFVDADDWLPEDALQILINDIEKNNADIVVGNSTKVLYKGMLIKRKNNSYFFEKDQLYVGKDIKDILVEAYLYGHPFPASLYAKLYKRDLFENTGNLNKKIHFLGEDLFLNIEIFLKASKVSVVNKSVYFYRMGGGTSKYMPYHFEDIITGYEIQKQVIEDYFVHKREYEYNGISIMLLNSFKTSLSNLFLSNFSKDEMIDKISSYIKNKNIIEACENGGSKQYFDKNYLDAIKEGNADYLYNLGLDLYNRSKLKIKLKKIISNI